MSLGELLAQLNEQIRAAMVNHQQVELQNLQAAKRTILSIIERNDETEEMHLQSLDTRG